MKAVKLIALILTLALLTCVFAACSENPLKAYAGTYEGKYTKYVGDETKDEEEKFSLVLKDDGTGTSSRGADYKVTWTLEGEKFTMQETFMGMTIDYTGTLKDGNLDIFNGDPTNALTCEYVYAKQ